MAKRKLGEVLVEQGALTPAQLETGLAAQQRTGGRLGTVLIAQGTLTDIALRDALARGLDLESADLTTRRPHPSVQELLRERFCSANDLFPLEFQDEGAKRVLVVAVADPTDRAAIEEIEFTTGNRVRPVVAALGQIRAAIRERFGAVAEPVMTGGVVPAAPRPAPIEPPRNGPPVQPTRPVPLPAMPARPAILDRIETRLSALRATPPKGVLDDLSYLLGDSGGSVGMDGTVRQEIRTLELLKLLVERGLADEQQAQRILDV